MTKLTYAEQLAHPKWQKRRLEMLNAADWTCKGCGTTEKQLHVHHRQYFKGRMAWEYAEHELQVLCKDCHEQSHDLDDQLKSILVRVPPAEVLALLVGFYGQTLLTDNQVGALYRDHLAAIEAGGLAREVAGRDRTMLESIWDFIVDADIQRGLISPVDPTTLAGPAE